MRQYGILRLLGDGATDTQADQAIGTSGSTVRRDLTRLARANGASTHITAGALFEALGWN